MKQEPGAPTPPPSDDGPARLEDVARRRLRSLRKARGWSLDELARRSHVGASTISRIETGHRRLALDNLVDLAAALDTTLDELLRDDGDDDVVIRPTRSRGLGGLLHWPLNRQPDPSGRVVAKVRLPGAKPGAPPDLQVHPGREWFYVLEGTVRLVLGDHEHLVEVGQAAEFDTMRPHWIVGRGAPADILQIFDRHGEDAHLRPPARTTAGGQASSKASGQASG